MRCIVVGDLQLCDKTPIRRKDSFIEAELEKLDQLNNLVQKNKPDCVFLLGDVFDSPFPGAWFVNAVIKRFKNFNVPIFSLIGNHSVHGNIKSIYETALGTLFVSGVAHHIEGDVNLFDINFRAVEYTTKHSLDLYKTDIPRVILTHNYVTPQKVIFDHILAKSVAASIKECLVLVGHYHTPYIYKDSRTLTEVVNPGVVIRTDISEMNIEPSVLLLEVSNPLTFHYSVLSLNAAKGVEIFNVADYQKEKQEDMNLQRLIEDIKSTQLQSSDIEGMIRDIALSHKVEDNVVMEAIERIRVAKQKI